MTSPDRKTRIARAKFRAWHRGTREADYMFGGFFDANHADWDEEGLSWFEALLDQDDVDVMSWALGTAEPPESFGGERMTALQKLDYVSI